MQGWLLFAVCSVLPGSSCWPYARAAERWKLTAAAVRCLRLALCAAYAYGRHRQSAKDLGTAVLRTLGHDGAIAGYLLPALPPSAGPLLSGRCVQILRMVSHDAQNLLKPTS